MIILCTSPFNISISKCCVIFSGSCKCEILFRLYIIICNYYGVRNPKFHLPSIKHSFAEQQVQYCLIKLLNEDREAEEIIHNIQNQNFCNFKSSLKYKIIASYSDKCVIIDCHTCKIIAENG